MKVVVYQIGARRHYGVARAFCENNALKRLCVDAASTTFPWRYLAHIPWLSSLPPIRTILKRQIQGIEASMVYGNFSFVVQNALLDFCSGKELSPASRWVRQNKLFCAKIKQSSWKEADAVYAYNGAALEIFERAMADGKRCILDQTAAAWRWNTSLLQEERQRWPDWEPVPGDLDDSGEMIAREEKEWELADRIICGSPFVVDSIAAVNGPSHKCRVVPYPSAGNLSTGNQRPPIKKPIRVLFVGTLQLRKGAQYLYEAAKQLDAHKYSIRMVGPNSLTPAATEKLRLAGINVVGPVPRDHVHQEYSLADVFVLPTLSEGSANVCHEAKAAGLPIITTPAAGVTPHPLVTLIPAMDSRALAKAIIEVSSQTKPSSPPMTLPARTTREYGRDLLAAIQDQ